MTQAEDRGLVSQIGPVQVDWPRTIGYYGGVAAAIAIGLVDVPVGLFIAAVPFFKMLSNPDASRPWRALGQLLEGASKPVGGDAEAVVKLQPSKQRSSTPNRLSDLVGRAAQGPKSIWDEAQQLK